MDGEIHNIEHEVKFVPGKQLQAKMLVSRAIRDVPTLVEQIRNMFGLAEFEITPGNRQIVTDDYFDTDDFGIMACHGSLRVRRVGTNVELTIKKLAGQTPGQLDRDEITRSISETEVGDFIKTGFCLVLRDHFPELVDKCAVHVLTVIDERQVLILRRNNEEYQLSIDSFRFRRPLSDRYSAPRLELEIEATNDSAARNLGDIKRRVFGIIKDLKYSTASKYEQGMEYLRGKDGPLPRRLCELCRSIGPAWLAVILAAVAILVTIVIAILK
jgi:hypothetical protein